MAKRIANNLTEIVGNTPLIRLKKIEDDLNGELIAKLEFLIHPVA